MSIIQKRIVFSLSVGLILGAILATLLSHGTFLASMLTYSLVTMVSVFLLALAWRGTGHKRVVAWMITAAFLLRIAGGVVSTMILPDYGYDSEVQKAGYLFYDAYMRDTQSWELSESKTGITAAFGQEFASDQYGGLLSLSAIVYRYLSPDMHRPLLIVILGAFTCALGIPYLHQALRRRWGTRVALIAGWIVALYPESILLGSSQMREPFLIGLICIAFWAVCSWKETRKSTVISAFLASMFGILLISSRVAAPAAAVLAGWFLIEHVIPNLSPNRKKIAWVLFALACAIALAVTVVWLQALAKYDVRLTEINSGRLQKAIEEIGLIVRIPFIIAYGLTQPVLPAAIADPAIPVWHAIAIFRAAGWYAIAPLLVYGVFSVWKVKPAEDRRILIFIAAALFFWIFVASIRAGGDQWDNPRYRTIFLPWMALLAAWAVSFAVQTRDAWLPRWLAVEVIFLGFFTTWYFSRYHNIGDRLPFNQMLMWIAGLSAVVIVGGLIWDKIKPPRFLSRNREK
ncbi:MAG: hypothetical protein AB9891_10255 [Anaerolineaceae bacterium]